MSTRYRLTISLILTTLLAGASATAGVVINGSVFGGGNEADVQTNTTVNISAGQVEGNVYGGGNLGDVGTIVKNTTDYNYKWTNEANPSDNYTYNNTGVCTVSITGGTIGRIADNAVNDEDHGNVFGAGKGEASTFWCEKAMVYETSVTISAGTVKRNVYGGGRIGRVENNTEVTIGSGSGSAEGADAPVIGNNVFGAGAGVVTHGYSALVRGNSTVTVQGNAKVVNSVYGGGELATVGRYSIATTSALATEHGVKIGMPYATVSGGVSTVNILGYAKIGPDASGHVFGAGKGVDPTNDTYTYDDEGETQKSSRPKRMTLKPSSLPDGYIYDNTTDERVIWEYFNDQAAYYDFLETLALISETHVTVKGNSTVKGSVYGGSESGFVQRNTDVKIQESCTVNTTGSGQNISDGNIFGGGKGLAIFSEAGKVKGNTDISISGGTMHGSVYGGGELGDVRGTTSITMSNGSVDKNVYGGGKGLADNFTCDKAMVGVNNEGEGDLNPGATNKGTNVSISNGTVYGNVYGGGEIGRVEWNTIVTIGLGDGVDDGEPTSAPDIKGSVFGAGKGLDTHGYSALVRGNCTVTVQGNAKIGQNVYGGGEIATAGRYWVKGIPYNRLGDGESEPIYPGDDVLAAGMPYIQRSGGVCNVTISGHAVIGPATATDSTGHVYGAGKGVEPDYIQGTSQRYVKDQGMQTFANEAAYKEFLQTLALVTNTTVTISANAQVNGSVYGGSENGFVQTNTNVNIQGSSVIGTNGTTFGNIYGGGKGLATFDQAGRVNGNATLAISGGTVYGSVFGGGQLGNNKGTVTVNVSGGEIKQDVYGGGALSNTNIDANTSTQVNLTGGIMRDVYGGGLGRVANGTVGQSGYISPIEAIVYGDVTVELNKNVANSSKGAIVNRIFGANNLNGTPKGIITVHVYATQNRYKETVNDKFVLDDFDITNISNTATLKTILSDKITIANALSISDISEQQSVLDNGSATAEDIKTAITAVSAKIAEKDTDSELATIKSIRYDVQAVYGGGNLSEYYPTNADSNDDDEKTAARTNVMIEGCNLTSINQVYGGGNAASVAGAHVKVDGTYEINEVFGGGNGNDPYQLNGLWYQNPGANIGFHNYTEITGSHTGTTINDAIVQTDKSDASTPNGRTAYGYGSGEAKTEIYGGLIHAVYGGSNQRGNIRTTAISIYDDMDDDCPVQVDETYGGGKNAPMDGTIQLDLDCVKNMPMIFGGAKNADINNDIELNITNGKFDKVFGGNNMGGAIYGSITVKIEEKGCQPIIIDELYGGGYLAPYSIYGYKKTDGVYDTDVNGKLIPLKYGDNGALETPYTDPRINIISATKINDIYGGGYQATVVGSPHVNVNMTNGKITNLPTAPDNGEVSLGNGDSYTIIGNESVTEDNITTYNAILAVGEIGTIYGGGNEADIIGDTYVEIGTGTWHNVANGELVLENISRNAARITGDVFGGGHGLTSDVNSAMVKGTTNIDIANGTIAKSVYGGGKLAQVDGNTIITVTGGTIGTAGQGGETYGNIYGGGKGQATSANDVQFGLIKGNTNVTVSGGTILHNIYGGGAYGSVGEFNYDNTTGMPTSLKSNTNGGKATITITGGTIGSTGVENGMVFGSSRGDVDDGTIHDKLAWVYDAEVVIGTSGQGAELSTPLIKGSVYGSGENGHTFHNTEVYIHSGTIGVDDDETVTYSNANPVYTGKDYNYTYHGNVYGGGCGTDTYSDANGKHYNPLAGIVYGETKVEITGGKITNNVYGAGAMGSVGKANKGAVHNTNKNELVVGDNNYGAFYDFGLSWPVAFTYEESEESTSEDKKYTGKTTVTVTGGQIGTTHSDAKGGNIYGAARGEAGDRYEMAEFANVRTSEVIIGKDGENGPQVKGSVFGGSANGHVYEDAIVRMYSGSVAKNLFGGGNGDGQYQTTLWDPTKSAGTLKDDPEDVHSWTAGKVYGNTYVYMYNGNVGQNVYGGGNLGSVGKGNYSGGKDDYSQAGYGELPEDDNANLWTGESSTDAYLFMNSGKAYVEIQAGTIGTENGLDDDYFPTGNVFGSSRGKAAFDVGQLSPRYKYVPDFFLGYVNETEVVIGNSTANQPRIYGSVYGGGQDGHVRRNTKVQVKNGIIGQEYSSGDLSSNQWMARGNVYGAGSGLGLYDTGQKDDQDNPIMAYNYSSGSVTCKTQVDIEGGSKIYQNVYGGGALSSVGPPFTGVQSGDETKTNDPEGTKKSYSYTQVNIKGGEIGQPTHNPSYGGNVYGASRGNASLNLDKSKFANVIWSELNVQGAATIKGSAFGGGEAGVVKHATEVNIGTTTDFTGTIGEDVYGGGEGALAIVGGNVTVNMRSGTVTGSIYGGGALANANTNTHETEQKTVGGQTRTVNTTGAQNTAAETAGMTTQVTMTGGTAKTVYGGGKEANIEESTIVNIEGGTLSGTTEGTITSAVFGGGYGQATKVYGSVEVNIGTRTEDTTGETPTVTYGGTASITGDVYGGSAKGKVNTSDGTNATENTTTSVNLYGGDITGSLYGGGLGDNTPDAEISANVYGPVTVTVEGGSATYVYGCNNLYGAPQSTVAVNINGTATPTSPATYAIGDVYGGGNLAEYGGSPIVSMSDGYVNNIFGGGNQADVAGSVTVTVSGGNVINDVYGGGALANTNTANWNFTNDTWAEGVINNTTGATTYNTTVNLTGGIIGNAYGGALGRLAQGAVPAVPAMVYGDVTVTVNGAALPAVLDRVEHDADNKPINILKGGRVFGCNNINGTPKGKVQVIVTQTNNSNPAKQDKSLSRTTITDRYHYYYDDGDLIDVAAVYGGGNASDYEPVTNQAPKVIIDGCNNVSIGSVYGGGNAAAVPATDVVVEGSYYIGYVFGGGFGAGSDNRGANVGYKSFPLDNPPTGDARTPFLYGSGSEIGNALVTVKGGYIDNVFGGSDTKGDVSGTVSTNISEVSNGCDLKIGSLYGGGRRATVDHDINTQIDCPSNSISAVYGGSEMADIHGNVTLTITAGTFDEVFGGNRKSGVIDGYITVNLEETLIGCRPIKITSLYGGCDDASFAGTPNDDGYNVIVNAKAFTSIGRLFGGSKGANATLTGNTIVNVNQTLGYWAGKHYPLQVPGEGGKNVDNTNPADLIPNQLGTIGTIYGGGDMATVDGNTVVNIGTETTVGFVNEPTHLREDPEVPLTKTDNLYYVPVLGANITGNVYGGGKEADVTGNTFVNICTTKSGDDYIAVAQGSSGVSIGGDVYGGGQGVADNFYCDKAMVGVNNAGVDTEHYPNGYPDGRTHISIGNGTVNGSVYGGGEIGRVEMNTTVLIGFGDGTTESSKPEIKGYVFGGGKGVETHGYSALVRGNPTVIIEGKAKVRGSVYGGGEIASVARYNVKTDPNDPNAPAGWPMNMPYALKDANSGFCTVKIQGYAEIGPDAPMKMKKENGDGPDDLGHVFGAGKGILPIEYTYADNDNKPKRMVLNNDKTASIWEYFSNEANYIQFIETLALASETEVEITGNAFVKGSVYGGSENGIVQYNTHVTIDGDCQIGAGENINSRYTAADWSSESLAECAHWDYAAPYAPYDLYNDSNNDGKPDAATDGHTFYGNVFGGGSGYYPYRRKSAALDGAAWVKDNDKSTELGRPADENGYSDGVWLNSAGMVRGNTVVDIKGGHVLTSIYGGNEQTDVQGSCTINMSGGTLGVPRTLQQIALHPVTCYLFGAGKGDPRVNFDTWTNVGSVDVNITGGKIFGSVFGGGEDGHVLGDVTVDISSGAKIGTTGTSYVDGNVFGGGRGFSGDAQTAGSVGGNIDVTITGGEMLGSIYGGGRLASVGTQFANPGSPDYGNFIEDNVAVYYSQAECDQLNAAIPGFIPAGAQLTAAQVEAYNAENPGAPKTEGATLSESEANEYNSKLPGYLTTESVKTPATRHGHVKIDISGGTIGNKNATGDGAVHSGNVFGGSMGRLDLLNGTRNPIWPKMAQVKSTAVNISGNAEIIRSVYGGGELGTVRDNAYVTIGGTRNNDGTITKSGSPTIYRDVYGGGYGSDDKSYTIITVKEPNTANPTQLSDYITNRYAFSPMQFAGCVGQSTTVNICGGYIWKSVYGGGEMASVGIFNSLVQDVTTKPGDDKVIVEQEGNTKWTIYSNIIKHYDDESTFALSWPYKFEYLDVFPGTTQINITGGRIGAKEGSDANSLIANNEDFGDVYGGGKGIAGDYKDYIFCANVDSTEITIDYTDDENKVTDPSSDATSTGNYITGAVYGGAENGHVMGDTKIILNNGLIGHSLYGGGSGKGQYPKELVRLDGKGNVTHNIYSITAGKVFGNTEIQMTGGYVVRNVYGGGTYGSVGKGNYAGGTDDYSYYYNNADQTQYNGYGEALKGPLWTSSEVGDDAWQFLNSGICKVTITGGTIGYIIDASSAKDGLPYGNVFGGCRGASAPNITEKPRYQYTPESFMGYANQTIVTIGTKDQSSENAGQPGKAPRIYGSVYGGGQDGHVRRDATVTIYSGEIGSAYDNTKFNDDIWLHSGNVYGAGSGIGKYKYDFNYDDDYNDNGQDADHTVQYHGNDIKEEDYSTSAGSVTRYTKVEIQGGKIHRNVYGGGSLASIGAPKYPIERTDGDPESHNEVIISGGQIGSEYSYDAKDNHIYGGNVYGASRGQEGLGVRFSSSVQTNVTISGGLIKGDVYGGGEIGAVKCDVDVNMLGGTIEHSIYGGGALANTNTSNWNPATDNFADGMVTTSGKITTTYNTKLNLLGGVIGGEAYGGGLGQLGNSQHNQSAVEAFVYGDVILNLNGLDKNDYSDNTIPSSLMSLMSGKVTQIPNSTHEYRVSTTGAIVDQIFGANNLNGTPKGHIKVHVFATQNKNALKPTISDKFVRDEKADSNPTLFNHLADSIIIAKQLTPSAVTNAMEALNANSDADDIKTALAALKTSIDNFVSNSADATIAQNKIDSIRYDVKAVYGGGNLAAYIYGNGEKIENTDANKAKIEAARTEVIIDGCDYTSIKTVYGGGNAASASGTYVEVNSTYEINEVFGGGNGADSYYLIEGDKTVWYENPGANVGYKNYTHVVKDGSKGDGSKDNPYQAIDNTSSDAGGDASTKENRKANYGYGSGIAKTEIRGGTIHTVYGGSNKKGNISTTALSVYEEADDDCQININETYGGGKDAPMDGEIDLTLDCVKDMDMIFGGAKNADVNSNITLNITNGRFKRVFGGNNTSGAINGSITVNIEENGCVPIEIDELYGGSYLAPYSIYGYEKNEDGSYHTESVSYIDDDNVVRYLDQRIPLKQGETGALTTPHNDPRINIISATHIGDVYGGGYQAKLVGSPHVNVNMTNGKVEVKKKNDEYVDGDGTVYDVHFDDEDKKNYATLDIGTIDNIYGGGNLADLVGNTYVEIGTGKWITWDDQHNPIWETVDASDKKYTSSQTNDAVNYTQAECNTHNEALTGYIASGVTLTSEKAAAVNTALSTTYNADDVINTEDAAAYNRTLTGFWTTTRVKTEAVLYTAEDEEVIAGTKQVGDVKTPAVYYTQAECNTHNATLVDYIACTTTLTAKQAVAVNEAIESNYAAGAIIYTEDAAAFNATLNGHITTADVKTPAVWTWYDANGVPLNTTLTPARNAANITGDVYGGGKGLADNFTCNKAMVGMDGDGINNPDGGTYVTIVNGTIGGSVYGGGMIARVEKNTTVTIGLEEATDATLFRPTSAPVINGNVFGAGKGVETHGYSALVRGNPTVIIQGNTKVGGSVYGGGEIASVARYKVVNGTPVALANKTSGNCKVIVRGNAEIGPDNMKMNNTTTGKPDNTGHVFGAGKGFLPKIYSYVDNDKPRRMLAKGTPLSSTNSTSVDYDENNIWEYFGNDEDYHKFIETLALSSKTDVTISDNAFVKGSVYGGSQNGIVQYNTHVTIEGDCQIGAGFNETTGMSLPKYNANQFIDPTTTVVTSDNALAECAHWDYGTDTDNDGNKDLFASYDPFAETTGEYDYTKSNYSSIPSEKRRSSTAGGMREASDGHTYYGNVFGGGSGVEPYAPGLWHRAAGIVRGNTVVDITGGHILTSVYGGNEHTDVGTYTSDGNNELTVPESGGLCTINFGGTATLGVPRTLEQIAAHPVTCYLFGAGKGDMRIFFNTWTNIREAEVNITGGKIYGSVFGGGEDGHVIENTIVNINEDDYNKNSTNTRTLIGTTGTSYVDGNVFGGGRGFSGEAQTAGTVGGNVTLNIKGGTMLGSVYGGGRIASVGTQFTDPNDPNYGNFMEDGDGKTYGHVTINISGGIIGNENATGSDDDIKHSGNVFGGSMGRITLINGTTNPIWPKMAQVKTAAVNIYGNAHILRNVYGGSELGTVRDNAFVTIGGYLNQNVTNGNITNPAASDLTITRTDNDKPTIEFDVYGGGFGSENRNYTLIDVKELKATATTPYSADDYEDHQYAFTPMQFAGCVGKNTYVNIVGGWVKKNTYGGGEMASVGIIDCLVEEVSNSDTTLASVVVKRGANTSTVYKNMRDHTRSIDSDNRFHDFGISWPFEFNYVPGFSGNTHVNITGGRLGITGKDIMIDGGEKEDNGDVFGAGKGIAGDYHHYIFSANVGSSEVYVKINSDAGPTNYKDLTKSCITGSVYAGSENGHVLGDTKLTLENGLIGHALYGGGKGKGTYETWLNTITGAEILEDKTPSTAVTPPEKNGSKYKAIIYSITAGKVFGNTNITMSGGYVMRNVYGGGNMGSVGKGNYSGGRDDYSTTGYGELPPADVNLWTSSYDPTKENSTKDYAWHFLNSGKSVVTITGGTIGYIDESNPSNSIKDGLPYGNVFGGCRGESAPNIGETPRYQYSPSSYSGYVNETEVTIGDKTSGPTIFGSVYGGGQDGHVRRDTKVIINNGFIGIPFSSDYNDKNYKTILGTDLENEQWLHRGNVYGAGSGIGKYEYDFNYDGDYEDKVSYTNPQTGQTTVLREAENSTSAGSVTRFTYVEINDGNIYRNVYGGGSNASIGAPKIPPINYDPYPKGDTQEGHSEGKQSFNEVIINGGIIGSTNSFADGYGGNVFGASRGIPNLGPRYATSVWTKVEANSGHIYGNVFGGGEAGSVTKDSKVIIGGKVENTNSGSGAPRRTTPAVQPDAAAPANTNSSSNSSNTSTPANVATEAPVNRSITTRQAQ